MSGLPYGLGSMLKDGHKHLSGLEEAVMKNIEACKSLSQIARTSLGPNGAQILFSLTIAPPPPPRLLMQNPHNRHEQDGH